jgi:histidinol phosphatase-like enzyme (inositol monophosphatase family)
MCDDIALANRLADAAGAIIRSHFRAGLAHEAKADASPVTAADRAAEEAMRRILDAEAPRDGIIGEEYGETRPGAIRQWVLDPIDGTISFMAGRPIFGTLIALLENGFPVLGVIDQPVIGERWVGAAGEATMLNGVVAATRSCRTLADAVLASSGPQYFDDHSAEHFMALAAKTSRRTVWGGDCYNYGLLSSGHLDLVVETGLKLHDFAALAPIVEGAGGLMCDWNGDPLHAGSAGDVVALGDVARLEEVLEALACQH